MSVRRASPADLDAVLAIEGAHATTAHWTRRQFEQELDAAASVFLVHESEGRVDGFVVGRLYPPSVEVLDIAVAVQRRGVGRALVDALAPLGEKITLEVSSRNSDGIAFYEALGFKTVGRRPRFYPDGADAVLMDRRI